LNVAILLIRHFAIADPMSARCAGRPERMTGERPRTALSRTPFVLYLIRDGTVEMDIGENLEWIAHAMLDAEMRLLCDMPPITNSKVPLRVFTADNISEVGNPADASMGYGDAYVEG